MPVLLPLVQEFHARSPLTDYPFSAVGTQRYFEWIMTCPDAVIFMHEDGLICGNVSDYPFCDLRLAREMLWYARRHGMVLLERYQAWVAERGAQIDIMSSIHSHDISAKSVNRALRMRGYGLTEYSHVRTV